MTVVHVCFQCAHGRVRELYLNKPSLKKKNNKARMIEGLLEVSMAKCCSLESGGAEP
jgi:hypothetical protein